MAGELVTIQQPDQMYQEMDFWTKHALAEISDPNGSYADTVVLKPKSLFKFGRNENVGTSEVQIVNMEQNETFVASNSIDTVSSSSGSDTGSINIEGHTISGNELTFVTQPATLLGTGKVTLSTPLARVTRLVSSTDLVGDVYVYEDDTTTTPGVPDTASKIHMKVGAGDNQSLKCATSFSSVDYFLLTQGYVSVKKKTDAQVDIRMKVRQLGNDFATKFTVGVTRGQPFAIEFRPYLIIPKNSDIIVTATASTTGVDVSAGFSGMFAKVVNLPSTGL